MDNNELIMNIEWVGECPDMAMDCPRCNGTGKLIRQATLDEVVKVFPEVLKAIKPSDTDTTAYPEYLLKEALTINNGQLRIKEV